MKDLDQKIIELMDLFDDEQITTADQIKRPEKALEKQAIDDFMKRNPMAGGGEVVIGKPGGLVQPETKFYAIKKTIKGTGDNAGKFTTYIGPRDNQTMYVGSKDYIDKIRILNQEKKYIGSNKEKKDIKKNIAVENKKAIKKNFKNNLGIDVEIGKNNLITGKGLTDELKKKISNAQTAYRKKNPGQASLINEEFWKYYSNIDKNKKVAATAAAEKEAAKIKAKDPNFIKELDRPLKKSEIVILNKSYQNIFKEEYVRLLNEGELFSKTDLARAVINRVTEENPTIDLQKGIGLDKIPGGGNEESKTIFDNINKLFTTKQKTNFTTNTNALAYTKNQDKLLQALLTGNNDFDDLMSELGFNEGRLKGNVNKLMKNLAQTDKSKQPLFFKKYNQKQLEEARNSIYESPTLESVYQRTIVQSVLQSTKLGSPERKQALQKLKEFNQFKKALQDNGISGKIISLDHAASYRAIKNGNLKNFLAVTPIISDINTIKSTFDRRSQLNLRRMQDAIQAGDNATYKKFLKNQTELEGIWKTMTGDQSSLGKIRVQPGGKAKGKTKIFDFGATSILDKNKNLINELGDNLKIRQNIVNASTQTNLDEVSRIMFEGSDAIRPKKSVLPESFKNLNKPEMFKTEKKIAAIIQGYSKLDKCRIGGMEGGRIGFKFSDECLRDGLKQQKIEAQKGNKKAARELVQIGKVATRAGLLKNLLGPGAILGEAVFEGAIIGNKVLGGKPADIAYAESYLSYLDPRKYSGQLDPLKMEREDMLQSTADKNILRSGFAAQDQLSAFNKAIQDRDLAKARGRIDQYNPAAADVREQAKFADQSADIISSEAFKDASNVAQEYLQGQSGQQQADLGVLSVPQGEDADNLRRLKANKAMKNLYTQYSDDELKNYLKQALGTDDDEIVNRYLDLTRDTKRIVPSIARTLSGLDVLRSGAQEQEAMQRIADAGGVANLAGGGIAKMAGDRSGAMLTSMNPDSQGLSGLLKRGIKT
jgi:hypothetical protein